MKYYKDTNGKVWTSKTLFKLYEELKSESTNTFGMESFARFAELAKAENGGELTEITR